MIDDHRFLAEITNLYYHRLRVSIINNNITFITDVRNRGIWEKEFLKHRENTVMEDLGEGYVMDKVIQRMKDKGMDEEQMSKMLYSITGRMIHIDNYCR